MAIKFSKVIELFEMVNFGSEFEHEGYICKSSGKSYFYSEYGDNEEELPDDIDSDHYLMIPYKSDLNLGNNLALDFVLEHLPTEYDKVCSFFRRRGAYSKFKSLLHNAGKLEQWYKFESDMTEKALREWCVEQGIEISP